METPDLIAARRLAKAKEALPEFGVLPPMVGTFRYLITELVDGAPDWAYSALSLSEAADLIESADTDVALTQVIDLDTGTIYRPEFRITAFATYDNKERIEVPAGDAAREADEIATMEANIRRRRIHAVPTPTE